MELSELLPQWLRSGLSGESGQLAATCAWALAAVTLWLSGILSVLAGRGVRRAGSLALRGARAAGSGLKAWWRRPSRLQRVEGMVSALTSGQGRLCPHCGLWVEKGGGAC